MLLKTIELQTKLISPWGGRFFSIRIYVVGTCKLINMRKGKRNSSRGDNIFPKCKQTNKKGHKCGIVLRQVTTLEIALT